MELLNLVQGSNEWIEARLINLCASEAPAMMGASKYMTRKQLLDLKLSGVAEPVSPSLQKIFDKGHESEETARMIFEVENFEDYPAAVGTIEIEDLSLLASFDGLSSDNAIWEHKLYNKTLAANIVKGTLEPLYYWQLEHQMLVAGEDGATITTSDGTQDNKESMVYVSVPERREELIKGWKLFAMDLEQHEIEAEVELVIADQALESLAVTVKVIGSQITTNITNRLTEVKALAKSEMSRVFETDQDFADKEQLNKDVKKARADLKERVAHVKGEFVSYSEFEAVASEMDSVLQKMQSHGEKQVKQAKEQKKTEIINGALSRLTNHIDTCNNLISAPFSIEQIIDVNPSWVAVIKNKRTIESLKDAIDTELNKWKVILSTATEVIAPNFKFLEDNANDYKFLFQDVFTLINQPIESFKAIVTTRINEHKEIEAKKLEEETARIKKEAKEKAEREAEVRQAAKLESERAEIRRQEQVKLQAEQEAKPKQPPTPLHSQRKAATKQVPTQKERNTEAIEAQSSHKPPHVDFLNWSRQYGIKDDAFLSLEKLLNKHFS